MTGEMEGGERLRLMDVVFGAEKYDAMGRPFRPNDHIRRFVEENERYRDTSLFFSFSYVTSPMIGDMLMSTMRRSLFAMAVDGDGNPVEEYYGAFRDHMIFDRGVFVIKSPMGTGKSRLIFEYLSPPCMRTLKVLMVSCRVAYASEISRVYEELGFVCYKDCMQREIIHDRVICSLESLKRLIDSRTGETKFPAFDIVIFDEQETLMCTMTGTTMKDRRVIANAMLSMWFRYRLTQVIIIDGTVTEFSLDLIARKTDHTIGSIDGARGEPKSLFFFYNVFRPLRDGQVKLITSLASLDDKIHRTIVECKRQEWDLLDYGVRTGILERDSLDVHNQIIVAHASKEVSNAWESILTQSNASGGSLNKETFISVDSESGRMYTNLELWKSKYFIQYTSTIAAGNDYTPPGRDHTINVFVHTGRGHIGADMMCQMAFRARFQCVKKYYFFIEGGADFDPDEASRWNIDDVLDFYNTTKAFSDTVLAEDASSFKFVPDRAGDEVVFRGRVVSESECAINFAYNEGKSIRHRNSPIAGLVRVLSDMSNEWDDIYRNGTIPLRCIVRNDHQMVLPGEAREEPPSRYHDPFIVRFEKEVAHFETPQTLERRLKERKERNRNVASETKTNSLKWNRDVMMSVFERIRGLITKANSQNVADLIKLVDMTDMSIVNSSATDRITIMTYKVFKMLRDIGFRSIPLYLTHLWTPLVEFVSCYYEWFQLNFETMTLLMKGTKSIEKSAIDEIVFSKETKYHSNTLIVKAFFILSSIKKFFPEFVEESIDENHENGLPVTRLVCLAFDPIVDEDRSTFLFKHRPQTMTEFDKSLLKSQDVPLLDFCVSTPEKAKFFFDKNPGALKKIKRGDWSTLTTAGSKSLITPFFLNAGIFFGARPRVQRRVSALRNVPVGAREETHKYYVKEETFDIHKMMYMSHLIRNTRPDDGSVTNSPALFQWMTNSIGEWKFKELFIECMKEITPRDFNETSMDRPATSSSDSTLSPRTDS